MKQILVLVTGWLGLVEAAATPALKRSILETRQHKPIKMPDWNYANQTTPDATPDGKTGVFFEPDLVDGKVGKDGGVVKKVRLGPYSLSPGQTKKG